jgi:DUF4097 and DUF4098 domain-containing protein YvlB
MSSYPPPPPGQYPPAYDRYAMKAQRQALRNQAKFQQAQQRAIRNQLRTQRRNLRRGSIVGPLIILSIGVIFLLAQFGKLSWSQSMHWYGRWWPAVLIAAGVVLLIEWAIDQNRDAPLGQTRVLGGGVVFLLIVLAITGLSARGIEYGIDWHDHNFDNNYAKWDHLFGDRRDADTSLSSAIPATSALVIHNPHGDVTITGSSSDGQVHVSVHTQTYAWKDSDAEAKERQLQPVFSTDTGVLTLNVSAVDGGQADLTVEMPRSAPLTVQAHRGDINISEMSSPITLTANHGDVDLNGIDNAVTVHVNDNDSGITMHSIHGAVIVQGHSGDIDISDVTGDVSLQGDFFGSTHLAHVNGAVHFDTTRTSFSLARLDEELTIDRDSLNASEVLGPVILKTSSKNITLDRVQGSVDLTDSNGSVEVTNAAPLDTISIKNRNGSVDLGLPGGAGFVLNAQTRNGDMENDFSLSPEENGETKTLSGKILAGGPTVSINTSDGDVTVRRSSVAPLAPTPPVAPRLTMAPPSAPKPPRGPRAPTPPRPPAAEGTF